jgi:hypothetical protein
MRVLNTLYYWNFKQKQLTSHFFRPGHKNNKYAAEDEFATPLKLNPNPMALSNDPEQNSLSPTYQLAEL